MCVNGDTHASEHVCDGQKTILSVHPYLLPHLKQSFWLFGPAHTRLTGPWASGDSPVPASIPCLRHAGVAILALHKFCGSELRSSHLPREHFLRWAISPATSSPKVISSKVFDIQQNDLSNSSSGDLSLTALELRDLILYLGGKGQWLHNGNGVQLLSCKRFRNKKMRCTAKHSCIAAEGCVEGL